MIITMTHVERNCYPSGAPAFNPGFSGVRVIRYLVLCVCFVDRCLSFSPFLFWPLCSVLLRFTDYGYPLVSPNSSSV